MRTFEFDYLDERYQCAVQNHAVSFCVWHGDDWNDVDESYPEEAQAAIRALLDRLERAEGLLEKYTREKPYECVDHYDAGKKLAREYSTFLAERPTT